MKRYYNSKVAYYIHGQYDLLMEEGNWRNQINQLNLNGGCNCGWPFSNSTNHSAILFENGNCCWFLLCWRPLPPLCGVWMEWNGIQQSKGGCEWWNWCWAAFLLWVNGGCSRNAPQKEENAAKQHQLIHETTRGAAAKQTINQWKRAGREKDLSFYLSCAIEIDLLWVMPAEPHLPRKHHNFSNSAIAFVVGFLGLHLASQTHPKANTTPFNQLKRLIWFHFVVDVFVNEFVLLCE